jgi:23S rRNA (guanosine2251-2'-O)-methyltransferase
VDRLYGRNSVTEALRAGRRRVHRVLTARDVNLNAPVERVDRHRLDALVSGANHQGIVAEVDPFPYFSLDELECSFLLALDSLQDPQNFGTLLRTALAVGVDGVIIPEHRAVSITPAVSNASAGAVEHLNVVRVTNLTRALRQLKQRGLWVYGLSAAADQSYWAADLTGPLVLVVGSEGEGLSRLVRETCDVLLNIPMRPDSIESLNAATAGSLVLYEAFRQRSTNQS